MYQNVLKFAVLLFISAFVVCELDAQTVKYEKDEFISVNPDIINDSFEIRLINRWKDFLLTKNDNPERNAAWVADDFKKHKYPYRELLGIEAKGGVEYFYKPTVLEISNTEIKQTYILKTAFIGEDKSLKAIFNVLVQKDTAKGAQFFFKSIKDYNTRDWQKITVGHINYVVSPLHKFDTVKAQAMDDLCTHFAEFFKTTPATIKYNLCRSNAEIEQLRGYDYSPIMYYGRTGGLTISEDTTIYAGIGSELYEHEAVHVYVYKLFKDNTHSFLNEGVATYLGGGNTQTYGVIRQKLKEHLKDKPKIDLSDFVPNNVYKLTRFSDVDLSLPYSVAAAVCEIAIREGGKDLLFKVLNQGTTEEDFWTVMSFLKITKANFYIRLIEELEKEPILP